ncbi:putative ubiquitin carboxyl-terminal hydrolase [Penicillium chrysogenum]|uniref:Pc21g14320 protein n=2 Tax=Penicillium chrysogenum species complex TaxID=254878 RepID=B6HHQ4_PENRW|nr:putative ubiquitin carboxyl-terminal hydrolase [Penicillium chrysogenum]CAP96329.1 Pc21g14320 [Penicillium rubens Wisconsin 54-1255]
MDPLPNLSVPETEVEDTVRTNTETESANQSPELSRSTPQAAPIPPSEELEHAYWAEYEEDTTVPDEDEMKEIVSGDSDYSASDHKYWETNFFRDLGDPEYIPTEKARLTWTFKGVRGTPENPNRDKIIRSPPAFVGGYWWRIKFYPRGNNVNALSVYLECSTTMPAPEGKLPETEFTVRRGPADASLDDSAPDIQIKTTAMDDASAWFENYKSQYPAATDTQSDHGTSDSWRVSAQVGVIVYNPQEPRTGWMQSSCHQFNAHNLDWGWTYFHGPWDQIHSRRRGQHRALLNDDTLSFDAYIRVVNDPTKSLWWHPSDSEPTWDSMALTGYRPLGDSIINHSPEVAGLASWLHVAPFCKIIQGVDVLEHLTNADARPKPLCDALQRLLWQLRRQTLSASFVDTDGVTSTLRNLHEFSSDVSEFWERLRRSLELELKGTEAGKQFAHLFDSPVVNRPSSDGGVTVNMLPTDFNSRIYVPVDQAKSTYEAVSGYLSAKPGRWSLPPLLHLEFGRHTLDKGKRWQLRYDKVELDEQLDLAPWVVDGQGSKYVLYGYIVHRGRRTSGKFFSILRPAGPGTTWLAFDDGSDNRVECLTQKTAMGPHLGLDPSQTVDHKKGHDVPVVAMYIRGDMISELLPGPQGPWEVPEALQQYYETGVYHSDEKPTHHVQVEVYALPQYDQLASLFDSYDLMAQAKAANSVMYMVLPRSSRLAELRKRIAMWKSSGSDHIAPERVRFWQIGDSFAQSGSSLAFDRTTDLNVPLDPSLSVIRFWMEIISEEDAQFFAIPDPPAMTTSGDKPDDMVVENLIHEASENVLVAEGDAVASSSGSAPHEGPAASDTDTVHSVIDDGSLPPLATMSPENDSFATERAEQEVVLAAAARDQQSTALVTADASTEATSSAHVSPPEVVSSVSEVAPQALTQSEVKLPVGHTYYFIQMFDADNQVLRTVGSFFSKLDSNVKASIRRHLQRPLRQDFLVWKRVDGAAVTTVSPADSFDDVVAPHGACFIVGDKLTKDKRTQLALSGLFTSPDRLVQYLWAESRGHPIQGFTGVKTIEANFTSDYYSGHFLKGYHHGRGKHISSTGMMYEGDFVFGRRHGQGKLNYPTGDSYDGDWVEDVCHGQGTYIEKTTGNKYIGGFKDGKRHGKGISYWEVADAELDLCQICYTEEMDAVFAECGHLCSCVACANLVNLCPMCRKEVKKVIKIYRA